MNTFFDLFWNLDCLYSLKPWIQTVKEIMEKKMVSRCSWNDQIQTSDMNFVLPWCCLSSEASTFLPEGVVLGLWNFVAGPNSNTTNMIYGKTMLYLGSQIRRNYQQCLLANAQDPKFSQIECWTWAENTQKPLCHYSKALRHLSKGSWYWSRTAVASRLEVPCFISSSTKPISPTPNFTPLTVLLLKDPG